MRLRILIVLLSVLAMVSGCATRAEKKALGAAYADLLVSGDTDKAREELKPVRNIYDKLFLMACAELNDGNIEAARGYAKRMVVWKPDVPDGKVLLGLIERRIAHPGESWVESFATAWKEEGSPEDINSVYGWFDKYGAAIRTIRSERYQAAYEASKGTPDELLMAHAMGLMNDSADSIWLALKYLQPDAPLEIRLLALSDIPPLGYMESEPEDENLKFSPELIDMAKTRSREMRRQLSAEFPDIMVYDLAIFVEDIGDKEVLDAADIERLEEISRRDKFSLPSNELYDLFYARYKDLGLRDPHFWALNAAINVTTSYVYFYRGIIKDTAAGAPDDMRLRLADILDNIGNARIKQMESIFLVMGATDIQIARYVRVCHGNVDSCAEEEPEKVKALTQVEEHDALLSLRRSVIKSILSYVPAIPYSWPIRDLNREAIQRAAENEVEYLLLFTDASMPMELKKHLK